MKQKRFKSKLDLVFYFLKGSKRYFLLGGIFACLLALFDLINPRIIGYTVDSVIADNGKTLPAWLSEIAAHLGGRDYLVSHLWLIATVVVAVALLGGVWRYLFELCNSMGAERLVQSMRDNLYKHIAHLPYSWHGENQTGDIIQRCTSDVETVKRFLSEQLTLLIRIFVLIVMSLYFMLQIHSRLTIVAAVSIPIVVLYSLTFHTKIGTAFQNVDEEEGRLSSIAQENLTGVRVVRAFGRERFEKERFETKNEGYTHMWIYIMKLLSFFWAANDLIYGIQNISIAALGAYFCVHGSLTAGEYIAFISYNSMLIWPVRTLGRVIAEMSKAGISIGRIQYIMNSEPEKDHEQLLTTDYTGDICFEQVSFGYENSDIQVLDQVSFTVPGGKTIGILGGTGSGKSTLVHLLDRLFELPAGQGRITIGGTDIASLPAAELRRHVGLVLQEPYLFSRTIEENISIGAENASHEDVVRASAQACLDTTIEHFTEGYQTYVGERGVTLSGGQKQRTAIAQTMIRNPEIMIFDDSLSAVDAQTDSKIRAAIQAYTTSTTVILVSHRITTLMNADHIVVLEKGRVLEQGSHQELMEQNGLYRSIYDLQLQQGLEM